MNCEDEILELLDRPFADREIERDLVMPVPAALARRPQADLEERRVAEAREDRLAVERRFEALCVQQRTADVQAHEADLRQELDRRERELADVGFVDRLVQNAPLVIGAGTAGIAVTKLLKALPKGGDKDGLADLVGAAIALAGVLAAGNTTPKAVRRERQENAAARIASEDRVRRANTEARLAVVRGEVDRPGAFEPPTIAQPVAAKSPAVQRPRIQEAPMTELRTPGGASPGGSEVPTPRRMLGEPEDFTPLELLKHLGLI